MDFKKIAAGVAAAAIAGGLAAATIGFHPRSGVSSAEAADLASFRNCVLPEIVAAGKTGYKEWSTQNSGELAKWVPFRDGILAGGNPVAPILVTHFGKSLVCIGGIAANETLPPPPTTTTTTTVPTTTTTTTTVPTTTTTTPTTTTTTTQPPMADHYVTLAGNDANLCTQSAPCRSLTRANQLAGCGSVVLIANGNYGNQNLTTATRTNCTQNAQFIGPATISNITFGSGSQSTNPANYVTLKNLKVVDNVGIWPGPTAIAHDIVLDGIDGGSVYIQNANNVLVQNSDLGPCNSDETVCGRNFILDEPGQSTTNNITFQNNVIHGYIINTPGSHWEAMYTRGGGNIVIRGNRFYENDTYHIRFENPRTWTVENNWFGDTCCYGGIRSTGGPPRNSSLVTSPGNVLVRFNSFAPVQSVVSEGASASGWRIVGNILGSGNCVSSAVYAFNLILNANCAGTGNASIGSMPYINASTGPLGDYHLSGSGIWDGFVTPTSADYTLTTDKDGQARSAPRDAGSDEH